MANESNSNAKGEGFFAAAAELLGSVRVVVNDKIETVTEPVMRDGFLKAAFLQGTDELWQAMKPFPDSIQVHEPGTFMNPLPSEVAQSRQEPALSLGDILKMNTPYVPEQDKGLDKGIEMG
jgi:hypothetical protein